MTSIAQLIKASDYACTGRYPVQALAMFLSELSISLYLPLSLFLSFLSLSPLSISLYLYIYIYIYIYIIYIQICIYLLTPLVGRRLKSAEFVFIRFTQTLSLSLSHTHILNKDDGQPHVLIYMRWQPLVARACLLEFI